MRPRAVAWLMQPASGTPALFLDRTRAEQQAVSHHGIVHDLFTHPPVNQARIEQGLAIADKSMLDVIEADCIKCDEHGVLWNIPCRSKRLREICFAINWLVSRGLATTEGNGVVLHEALEG